MPTAVDHFFKNYAKAYDNDDANEVVSFYHIPAVLISDENKKVYSLRDELVSYFEALIMELQTLDVVRHEARVMQLMKLSETIIFTNVTWLFFNPSEEEVFSCTVSYTLQKSADDNMAIIIAVLDDEEKQLTKLLS
jgi:ketosteroid isomerase-like protein